LDAGLIKDHEHLIHRRTNRVWVQLRLDNAVSVENQLEVALDELSVDKPDQDQEVINF
jgi:hypothetical protein